MCVGVLDNVLFASVCRMCVCQHPHTHTNTCVGFLCRTFVFLVVFFWFVVLFFFDIMNWNALRVAYNDLHDPFLLL